MSGSNREEAIESAPLQRPPQIIEIELSICRWEFLSVTPFTWVEKAIFKCNRKRVLRSGWVLHIINVSTFGVKSGGPKNTKKRYIISSGAKKKRG